MYVHDETQSAACFDPNNNMSETDTLTVTNINVSATEPNGFTSIDPNNLHNHNSSYEFQPPMSLEFLNPNHQTDTYTDPNNNWTPSNINVSHEMGYPHFDEHNLHSSTTDLLTLLHLPGCSFASSSTTPFPPTPSISFGKSSSPPPPPPPAGLAFLGEINPAMMHDNNISGGSGSSTLFYDPVAAATLPYDPLFHLNLPPQPSPLLRDLMFQTLPHGTRGNNGNVNGSTSTLFGGSMDHHDEEGNNINNNMSMSGLVGIYQDGDHLMNPNGVFEFSRGDDGKMGKGPKNFVTERQRRQNFNDKYKQLQKLIPTPTKQDRASIVHDAISYIHELKRTVGELKLLVEKKRISKERVKRHKTGDDPSVNGSEHQAIGVDGSGLVKPDPDEGFGGSATTQLRSSWLQRKCKDTEVDVRIVDDEVTIKLVQRKKINCLLAVSRTLDDLQLDLRHVAGGHVGDYYSYLYNSKICEGSSVYARVIADKLIEVVERQYAAASVSIATTTSYD